MKSFLSKSVVWLLMLIFGIYFGVYCVLRYQTLHSAYFDLGIMHQAVYNTYRALQTGDYSRFLEITDPHGSANFMRAAVHVDLIMAIVAPFYFILASPATLIVSQVVVVALGAHAVYLIAQTLFKGYRMQWLLSVVFAFVYLMHPAVQLMTIYDYHAVTFGATAMLYFVAMTLRKRYILATLYAVAALLSKEQVPLTMTMWGLFFGYQVVQARWHTLGGHPHRLTRLKHALRTREIIYPACILLLSVFWFFVAVFVLTPYYRGGDHFATERYSNLGDSPSGILLGFFIHPLAIIQQIFHIRTLTYILYLWGPYAFLTLFAPLVNVVMLPELAINILSQNASMQSIQYHYTAILHPPLIIGAMYGARFLLNILSDSTIAYHGTHTRHHHRRFTPLAHVLKAKKDVILSNRIMRGMGVIILLGVSILFSAWIGPLPYSRNARLEAFHPPTTPLQKVYEWQYKLRDDSIKVSTTTAIAPFFSGRRYYYYFSNRYTDADFIILNPSNVYKHDYDPADLVPSYKKLQTDDRYELIDSGEDFVVYKKKTAVPVPLLNEQSTP